jgi:hypothetical protein
MADNASSAHGPASRGVAPSASAATAANIGTDASESARDREEDASGSLAKAPPPG